MLLEGLGLPSRVKSTLLISLTLRQGLSRLDLVRDLDHLLEAHALVGHLLEEAFLLHLQIDSLLGLIHLVLGHNPLKTVWMLREAKSEVRLAYSVHMLGREKATG